MNYYTTSLVGNVSFFQGLVPHISFSVTFCPPKMAAPTPKASGGKKATTAAASVPTRRTRAQPKKATGTAKVMPRARTPAKSKSHGKMAETVTILDDSPTPPRRTPATITIKDFFARIISDGLLIEKGTGANKKVRLGKV